VLLHSKALCDLFGEKVSLQHDLSLALQFSRLNFEQIETIHKYDITPSLEAIDAKLESRLSDAEKQDTEYQLKVIYTLQSAAKTGKSTLLTHFCKITDKEPVRQSVISQTTAFPLTRSEVFPAP
jgi:hypothetical protein